MLPPNCWRITRRRAERSEAKPVGCMHLLGALLLHTLPISPVLPEKANFFPKEFIPFSILCSKHKLGPRTSCHFVMFKIKSTQ